MLIIKETEGPFERNGYNPLMDGCLSDVALGKSTVSEEEGEELRCNRGL